MKYTLPRIVLTALSIGGAIIFLLPFYLMFVMSTENNTQIFAGLSLIPGSNLLRNFQGIGGFTYFRPFLNSIIVGASSVVLTVFFSAMAGFGIAKYNFKHKDVVFGLILATLMVPPEIGIIAYVTQMRIMRLNDTYLPLIIPSMANAFGVFWMTGYMKNSIPAEILDSGRIDGCNDMGIFLRLVLPIIKPALFTLSIVSFVQSWNNYMLPLVLINDPRRFTVPLAIAAVGTQFIPDYGARILGITIGILPVFLIFLFTSKVVTKGLTEGAVKG